LRRALELAQKEAGDAFLIAGDLFEDNEVEDSLVTTVLEIFSDYPSVPIFILPGNHDPHCGPESVWLRRLFSQAPSHVRVFLKAESVDLGGAWLLAAPLHQKMSTFDPTLKLIELARDLPPDSIKIGISHGALAIEGKHQPNDFPIALNAASRAGLDYLAIGHWHNWLSDVDGGRIVMPGTPEPDQFSNERSGLVALVEIPGRGKLPKILEVPVATLIWKNLRFDFLSPESSRATLESELASLEKHASHTVLRLILEGTASPNALAGFKTWLESALKPFLVRQIVDRSSVSLTPSELQELQCQHPILTQVLEDIDRLESMATGRSFREASALSIPISLAEAQTLLGNSKISLTELRPEHFALTRQLLLQTMREITS